MHLYVARDPRRPGSLEILQQLGIAFEVFSSQILPTMSFGVSDFEPQAKSSEYAFVITKTHMRRKLNEFSTSPFFDNFMIFFFEHLRQVK